MVILGPSKKLPLPVDFFSDFLNKRKDIEAQNL